MTAILVPEFRTTGSPPAPRTATAQATPMPIAVAARRWQVSPASSVASVRADRGFDPHRPIGRGVEVVVDLSLMPRDRLIRR